MPVPGEGLVSSQFHGAHRCFHGKVILLVPFLVVIVELTRTI